MPPESGAIEPSRRALLRGTALAGLTGAAGVIGTQEGSAAAAATYRPGHYRGAPLLSDHGRHLVGRFSYGVTRSLAARVRRQGGAVDWFERQLEPARIPDRSADELAAWWPSLTRGPAELFQRQLDGVEAGWEVMLDYERWVLMRRIRSRRQVHEVMTEFWENLFHVPANGDAAFTHRADYAAVVRAGALGRFDDLLHATITHPAMLIYLDNAISTAAHPNENLGRELLELHTVGRGVFDEADVKSAARILTGWKVAVYDSWEARYEPADHWVGPVQVLGFSDQNSAPDGRDLTRRCLSYLAHHPATAQRIARRLATKFVRDQPPQDLVDHLAAVYLRSGTEIKPVLRALVGSRAFATSVGSKVRDPGEDVVATYRALGVHVMPPTSQRNAVNFLVWQAADLGGMPFAWPRPDGQPLDNESWASPARMIASLSTHYAMAGGWWPTEGITYRPDAWWVTRFPMRFDVLVDRLSQEILHRRSTATLLQACCQAVDCTPREQITREHPLIKWAGMARLLTTFLDSPAFLTR